MKGNLKGNQTKLDANKDGKIGKAAFAMLRNKKGAKKMAGGGMMKPKMGHGGEMKKMGHGGEMKKMGMGGKMMKTYAYGSSVRKPMAMGGMSAPMHPRTQRGMGIHKMMGGGMMKKMRYGGSMKKKS